jgi:hypothetical protein
LRFLFSDALTVRGNWLLVLLLVGCRRGPQLAPVSGTVKLDGKPLALAEVTFQPENHSRASHGVADASGHYVLRYNRDEMGALVGQHSVQIRSATEVTLPNGKFELRPQLVPPRYNSQTELRREVKAGSNEFDFELSSKAK